MCTYGSAALLSGVLLAGCGNTTMSSATPATGPTGTAFVIGTDAPLASVVSFSTQIQSIDAIDGSGNAVPLLSGTPTVDFARFNGLQTMLDMNSVPVGTYSKISVTFGSATIGYLQTGTGVAPNIQTMPAVFNTSTVTDTLTTPLVVTQTGPVGIHLDFLLNQSIVVDGTGAITGNVNPTLNISAVGPGDPGAYIDEYDAGVVSVDTAGQSFVIQGPHGANYTVSVNAQTDWDDNASISSLTSSSIVQISGMLDKASSTINADEVAILSQSRFYASGQVTDVQPASGAAKQFQFYVRSTLPTPGAASGNGVTLGQIAQVNLSGSEKFFIYWMHNRFTQFLFNPSMLVPGQHLSVGGPLSGAADAQALSVNRVMLKNWGFDGTVVANSVNTSAGSFQMTVDGFAGLLVPGPVTVYVINGTRWRHGWSGISDLSAGAKVRVVGVLMKDPGSGAPILLGRYVDDMKGEMN